MEVSFLYSNRWLFRVYCAATETIYALPKFQATHTAPRMICRDLHPKLVPLTNFAVITFIHGTRIHANTAACGTCADSILILRTAFNIHYCPPIYT
jgi:hypothetical protein